MLKATHSLKKVGNHEVNRRAMRVCLPLRVP